MNARFLRCRMISNLEERAGARKETPPGGAVPSPRMIVDLRPARRAVRAPRLHGLALRVLRGLSLRRSSLAALALLFGATAFSGCAGANLVRVKPWERATLTDYTMRPDRDPLYTVFAEHIYFSRETATGGRGVGGSGCGCN